MVFGGRDLDVRDVKKRHRGNERLVERSNFGSGAGSWANSRQRSNSSWCSAAHSKTSDRAAKICLDWS
jgi:hypothetical protein